MPQPRANWDLWWEFNKLRYLRPNALEAAPVLAGDVSSSSGGRVELAKARAREIVRPWLDAPQARVRARALMAHARLTGPAALDDVHAALEDSAREVRLAAILALGVTDSEEAVHRVLELIRDPEITPASRAFAAVALASLRARGFGTGCDAILPYLIEKGDDMGEQGLLLHQLSTPSEALAKRTRSLAGLDKSRLKASDRVRARAVGALRHDGGSEALSRLLDKVGGHALPERRAAALALAGFEEASQPVRTAFELERDELTRGYLLASLGELGGEPARDFLIRVLRKGKSAQRPWAALALGQLAGESDDAVAREALRAGFQAEKNRENRGALCLALGLANDEEAAPLLRDELGSKSTVDRSRAALALGLLRRPEDRELLRTALVTETSPLPRSALAQALALHGHPGDTDVLLEELRDVRDPVLQAQLAVAVGFHGTLSSAAGLEQLIQDRDTAPEARAAALDALGIAYSGADELFMARVSGHADFASFPGWMLEMFQYLL